MRRLRARAPRKGLGRLGLIAAMAAAIIPFVWGEVPVFFRGASGTFWPILRASDPFDRAAFCSFLAAIAWFGLRGRPRTCLLLTGMLILLCGVWIAGVPAVNGTGEEWRERAKADPTALVLWPIWPYGPRSESPHQEAGDQSLTWRHPLGVDENGRDVLARSLYGLRLALALALCVATTSGVLGVLLGGLCALSGSIFGFWLRFAMQFTHAFPVLLLLITVASIAGEATELDIFGRLLAILALTRWTGFARITRHQVQLVARQDWVLAARAHGSSWMRIVWRHILPHAAPPLLIHGSFTVIATMLLESALSFLGLGFASTTATLGGLLASLKEDGDALRPSVLWAGLLLFATLCVLLRSVQRGLDPEATEGER